MQECKYEVGKRYRKVSGDSRICDGEEVVILACCKDKDAPIKVGNARIGTWWLPASVVLEPVEEDTPACPYVVGKWYRIVRGGGPLLEIGHEVKLLSWDPTDTALPFKVFDKHIGAFWLRPDITLELVDGIPSSQPQRPAPAPSAVPLRDQVYGKAEHEAYMARQHDNEQLKTACHQWKEGQMTQAIRRFLCGPGIEHSDTHGIED
jgi:hypothetical protein